MREAPVFGVASEFELTCAVVVLCKAFIELLADYKFNPRLVKNFRIIHRTQLKVLTCRQPQCGPPGIFNFLKLFVDLYMDMAARYNVQVCSIAIVKQFE